jgi:hypothetical protein
MNKLPGPLYKELLDALLSAFPTYEKLEQMARFELDENLTVIAGSGILYDVCFQLIKWAETNGQIGILIRGALVANPGNPALAMFWEKYKSLEQDSKVVYAEINPQSLANLILRDAIQSVSLILDFSTSPIGVEYSIGGRRIYLLSLLDDRENPNNKTYRHLNIYFPIQYWNISDMLAEEQDEILIGGLVNYVANQTKIVRVSVERFGRILKFLKAFVDLEELIILDCNGIGSDISDFANLPKLVIKNTIIS